MFYVLFWVHSLAQHAPKFPKYPIIKFGRLTLSYSNVSFKKKPRRTIKLRKTAMSYIWFRVHWLVGHAPESVKYKFTKFGRLSVTDHREGAKITLKSFFLSSRRVLIKNKRALSNTENWWKWLIFDSGCSNWQSTPQNLLNIDLANLVSWLQKTIEKEQKLFWNSCF